MQIPAPKIIVQTIIELDPGVNIDNDLAFVDTQSKKACNMNWTCLYHQLDRIRSA